MTNINRIECENERKNGKRRADFRWDWPQSIHSIAPLKWHQIHRVSPFHRETPITNWGERHKQERMWKCSACWTLKYGGKYGSAYSIYNGYMVCCWLSIQLNRQRQHYFDFILSHLIYDCAAAKRKSIQNMTNRSTEVNLKACISVERIYITYS